MKQLKIFGLLLMVVLIASCIEEDDQVTGVGDVIVVSKQSDAGTVYGISIYAYTYSTFSSVSVVGPGEEGQAYQLKADGGNFYYETPVDEFSALKPAAGTYQFSATFKNGVRQEFQNTLSDQVLPVPSFEKCEYNELFHQLEIDWPLINGASSYAINILEGSRIVFKSNELKYTTRAAYAIKTSGGGWDVDFSPVAGKTYTVRLFAYMYEPSGGSYNIQSISLADHPVVWGN